MAAKDKEFRVLSATAILGYGFPERSFRAGLKRRPHLIGVDAGSTDPGPYYLGAGKSFTTMLGEYSRISSMTASTASVESTRTG